MFSRHNVLTIPGGADLPIEFHSQLAKVMVEEWQSCWAQGFKTFVNPVENTVSEQVKRRDAGIEDSEKGESSTQPPAKEVSTYKYRCSTLREMLRDREVMTEDFNAFLSTDAPTDSQKKALASLRYLSHQDIGLNASTRPEDSS